MAKRSAGILLFRRTGANLQVLLVHPGGPVWAKRDEGIWSIPKGQYAEGEDACFAARREFEEELDLPCPDGAVIELGEIVQASGKRVSAWALAGNFDPADLHSSLFTMQWPPRSGRIEQFPDVNRHGIRALTQF